MGEKIVKNYPSPRLMETIGATNQKPSEAIGELVANSFDARVGEEKLNITIDMRNHKIIVLDDGKGMTLDVLERAVCIAEDMSRYVERGQGAKGHFGMGFKTSCSTLGKYYEIYTRPQGEEIEYHVGFDIGDYSNRPSGADAWDVKIFDDKPSEKSPLGTMTNGTAFVISRLKNPNIIVSAVLSYLGEAFKGHLKTGDKITIIDSAGRYPATPKKYNLVKGSRIEIDEVFGENNKYHVKGWVGLDSQTHNDGLCGFNIYRNNQLVEKWDKSWFRVHLMTSRIIGEVNMDFLDATFYKQGIQQSEDWKIVSEHMTAFLKPIVSASRDISRKGNINKPSEVKRIISTLASDYGIEENELDINEEDGEKLEYNNKTDLHNSEKETGINNNIKAVVKERNLYLEEQGEIKITYIEKEGASFIRMPFDYAFEDNVDFEDETSELQVVVFKNHPLWKKKIDGEIVKIIATADAIYRMLVEKLDFDTSEALKIRTEWLNHRVEGEKE